MQLSQHLYKLINGSKNVKYTIPFAFTYKLLIKSPACLSVSYLYEP